MRPLTRFAAALALATVPVLTVSTAYAAQNDVPSQGDDAPWCMPWYEGWLELPGCNYEDEDEEAPAEEAPPEEAPAESGG